MDQHQGYQQQGWGLPRKARFNHASTLRRIGAYIIDIILLWIFTGLLLLVFIILGFISWQMFIEIDPDPMVFGFYRASYLIFITAISAFIHLAYFTFLESEKGGGATIGKRVLDIKVVDEYGKKVDLVTSFIRNIVRWLWQIPCIGLIILIIDVVLIADSDQRIGDRLASTYVVKESGISRVHPDHGTSQGYPQQRDRSSQQTPPPPKKDEPRRDQVPPPPPDTDNE